MSARPPHPSRRRALSALLTTALAAGCVVLGPQAEPPRVSMADLGVVDAGILEQRFRMKLRIQNPSSIELAVKGVDVRVELNGKLFMTGLGHDEVSVPALGTATVEVEAFSTLTGIVRQFNAFTQGERKTLSYRMQGVLIVGDSRRRVRFEDTGEVDWPGALSG
jgi:LEA14-like dessication related protein